ncbi:hypothetical protein RclHR1_02400001 [Rhizophagus clarus]|uniref:Uncharacterized protein n=1 Tax=Rhizophagus clarus TaxID=94130 RepID=A0A2Z6QYN0_9GLOM|nr:hypothetical protein RclHR1_02400001 [Rhizophagus clarus]
MSILNLRLQSVGLMRNKMNNESENLMNKCGTMNEICKIAEENPRLKEDLIATASEMEIERFWETIQLVDESVTHEDHTAEQIKQRAYMQEFMEHYCKARHYFFSIKKCDEPTYTICRPFCCSPEDSKQLHFLPDPVPGEDLHYKSFKELYGMQTTEDHRTSFKSAKAKKKDKMTTIKVKHSMPFCPSAVHAKNVVVVVNCVKYIPKLPDDIKENMDKEDDCNEEVQHLDSENEEFDKNMEDSICNLFSKVFVNDLWTCVSQVEKLYYSAGIYPEVCIECESLNVNEVTDDKFPRCSSCGNNTAISKKC